MKQRVLSHLFQRVLYIPWFRITTGHVPSLWRYRLSLKAFLLGTVFAISAPAVSRGTRWASGAAPKGKVCFFGGTAKAQPVRTNGGGAEIRGAAASSGSRRPQLRRARLGRLQAVKRSGARGRRGRHENQSSLESSNFRSRSQRMHGQIAVSRRSTALSPEAE